jgi:hypothetical protein
MAFAFGDEFLDGCRAAYDTFAMVRDLFSPREQVELLLLIGYFRNDLWRDDDAGDRGGIAVGREGPGLSP